MKAPLSEVNQARRTAVLNRWWLRVTLILLYMTHFSSVAPGQAKEWDKTFGGGADDNLTSLEQTSDGGYILGGWSSSPISGDKTAGSKGRDDYWVVKLDAAGEKEWDRTFGGNRVNRLSSLQQTSDGGYILGGESSSPASGDKTQASRGGFDYWVVKLNAAGEQEWDKTLGGSRNDNLTSLQQTSEGGYILGGISTSPVSGDKTEAGELNEDYWVVKLNAAGEKEWDRAFGSGSFHSLRQTSDGGYILGGTSSFGIGGDKTEASRGGADYWVLKLDAAGEKEWDRTLGGSGFDGLSSLRQTSDGGYILGGNSSSPVSGDKTEANRGEDDYWIVKLDAAGAKEWDRTYGGVGHDQLHSLRQTSDGGYILGGGSNSPLSGDKTQASGGGFDYWVVKLEATGSKEWDRTFGGSEHDVAESLQQTGDGGYILGGWSSSDMSGDKTQATRGGDDYWVVKLSGALPPPPLQTKQWDKTFGGLSDDNLIAMQQTSDGGYILGGYSSSPISGDKTQPNQGVIDYWVVKLDAAGEKEWDRTFGGSELDGLLSLQQTSDGGYVLGGWSSSPISGDKTEDSMGIGDYWVVKLDATGIKEWDRTFGGSGNDALSSLQQTSDGGYILGGASSSDISGDKTEASRGGDDYWVVKLDAAGAKEWDRTYGGSAGDLLSSIQQTSDGGYILGGSSQSGSSGDKTEASRGGFDYWVVKLDAAGAKEWDRTYGGSAGDLLSSLRQTSNGGYILGGFSGSATSGDKTEASRGGADYWVLKLDNEGAKEWDRTLGGSGLDNLTSLQQTSDGGYILGGYSNSDISGDKSENNKGICFEDLCTHDYWVLKLDAAGAKEWDQTFGGSGNDELYSLQQTSDGGYILGGGSDSPITGDKTQFTQGGTDYWVVKLGDTTPCSQSVSGFTLVNADTDEDLMALQEGDVLDLTALPTRNLRIRADTSPDTVGSVIFALDGSVAAVESLVPYRFYATDKLTVGTHTLTATTYCEAGGEGAKGTALTVSFEVVDLAVESFTLVNASTEQDLMPLQDGDVVDLSALPTRFLSIRASASQTAGIDVVLELSGAKSYIRRELGHPYSLFGDEGGSYHAWTPAPGTYTLTATPYWDTTGARGKPLTIFFTVVKGVALAAASNLMAASDAAAVAFPNPTGEGRMRVVLPQETQGELAYTLYSSMGARLTGGELLIAKPATELEFDFSSQMQAPGVYYLRLKGQSLQAVLKVVRQ